VAAAVAQHGVLEVKASRIDIGGRELEDNQPPVCTAHPSVEVSLPGKRHQVAVAGKQHRGGLFQRGHVACHRPSNRLVASSSTPAARLWR
jgi:hypothetical protein